MAAALSIVHANADKLDDYENETDNGIIAVGELPPQPSHAPLVVNDTDNNDVTESNNSESNNNKESNDNAESNDNNLPNGDDRDTPTDLTAAPNADKNKSNSNQGMWRLQRMGKGTTMKYANYSVMIATR